MTLKITDSGDQLRIESLARGATRRTVSAAVFLAVLAGMLWFYYPDVRDELAQSSGWIVIVVGIVLAGMVLGMAGSALKDLLWAADGRETVEINRAEMLHTLRGVGTQRTRIAIDGTITIGPGEHLWGKNFELGGAGAIRIGPTRAPRYALTLTGRDGSITFGKDVSDADADNVVTAIKTFAQRHAIEVRTDASAGS